MSLALLFHYLMLNMFRMLVHPSSGACHLFVELFHGLYCSGTMCVGVTLWFGWSGVVSGYRLQRARAHTHTNKHYTCKSNNGSFQFLSYCSVCPFLISNLPHSCGKHLLHCTIHILYFSWFQTFAMLWMLNSFSWVIPQKKEYNIPDFCCLGLMEHNLCVCVCFRFYSKTKAGCLKNVPYVDNSWKWAGGGLLSTVGDLLRFGNAMMYSYQWRSELVGDYANLNLTWYTFFSSVLPWNT